jgi:VWFA-related protein
MTLRLALLAAVAAGAAQQTPFRAGVDVVTLEVSVLDRNTPVAGLTARDFTVLDNGVKQAAEVASAEGMPVDVTLLVDVSGSMAASTEQIRSQLESASSELKADDRIRLVTFGWDAHEAVSWRPGSGSMSLEAIRPGGGTSLYDALTATLMRSRRPGRAELAVVFTDAVDTSSAVTPRHVEELASRSDVLCHVFVVRSPEEVMVDAAIGRPDHRTLAQVTASTGGTLGVIGSDSHVSKGFLRALAGFRASYTLRYTLTGVARPGWHTLTVTLNRPGEFVVRARRGYFGG